MKEKLQPGEKRVWVHTASLGEFEQGRPVIERIKKDFPQYKIVLTFFSPSGYQNARDYEGADYVFYLPLDGSRRSKDFVEIVKPELAIFIKYEFWYHYLNQLHKKRIPSLFVSAAFRKKQAFFKWYGKIFRKILASISV